LTAGGILCECPQCEQECAGNDCGPDGFHVKISFARGAASPFEMRIFQRRRADQLTMPKKIMGREPAASAALKIWDEEQLRNSGGDLLNLLNPVSSVLQR
jgi:hypothetical protein